MSEQLVQVPGQFGAKYNINFIENPAFIQQYSFHQSHFHFSNILLINTTSNSTIEMEAGLMKILLKWKRDRREEHC